MRSPAVLAALTVFLMAGCAAPAPTTDVPVEAVPLEPSAPTDLDWRLIDCEVMTWSIPVPATNLAPYLPGGFQAEPAALPEGVDQAATLGIEATECTAGLGEDDTILRSVQFGRIFTPVIPPAEARDRRFGAEHDYDFAVMAAGDDWRHEAQARGLPVHDGGSIIGAAAQGWSGALAMDGVGTISMTGRTLGDQAAVADVAVRHFTVADGDALAAWVGTATERATSSGVGVWQATPGSWVAQVVGATSGPATFDLGRFTIGDGRVGPLHAFQPPPPTDLDVGKLLRPW